MVYRPNRLRSSAPPFGQNLVLDDEYEGLPEGIHEDVFPNEQYFEEEPEEEDEFIVEKVVDKRKRYNTTQYLVKWLGYDESANSWKSIKALEECQDLIDKYERSLRPSKLSNFTNRALVIGIVVTASLFAYMFVSVIEMPAN